MSLQSLSQKKTKGLSGLSTKKTNKKLDLSSVEGLYEKAKQTGVVQVIKQANKIVEEKPKLSKLQRLVTALDVFNPAEAILRGVEEKSVAKGIGSYVGGALKGIGSAVIGKDFVGEKRHFKQVAEELGVENKIAKFGLGFVGDVLLDPSTYFGGALAKGLAKGVGKTGSIALKGIGKVAPTTEAGLRLAGTGLQDAVGRAFKYGYKTTKGAKEDILSFMSRKQKAQLGLAASNLDRLGTGVLTKSQREELALKLIAGKRSEFLAKEAGQEGAGGIAKEVAKSSDPVVQEAIEKQISRSKGFGEAVTENPYEVYFPFIKKDKLDKFIKGTQGIKVGSEGYKKQFKNILTNENIELDPAKAFFTSESQIVSDKMTRDFLGGFVKKYGKGLNEFKNSDEAVKAGYDLIKEKGIFGKELGYVSKFDANLIKDSLSPEFQTINMLAKASGFDAITSLFKRSVTGLFAPFHIRNYVSGNIQNFEVLGKDALNPRNISIGQKIAYFMGKNEKLPNNIIELGGKKMKFSQVMKPFMDRFSGDTFYNTDFDMALKSGSELKSMAGLFSKQRVKETIKTAGLGQEAIPFKIARGIGQYIEHQQKATAYVTALSQGKKIDEALKLAEMAGFDYRALTRFESQIMRRIVPFYSFSRKNLTLQLNTLGENPQRINQIMKFFGNIGEPISEEEKKYLPDYMKESIGIKIPDTKDGLKQYISSFGTPVEAFTQLFGSNPIMRALSMANPLIKAPVEIAIGKDSFRNRDLKDVYTANEYKMAPQFIKDMLDIVEVDKPIYKKDRNGKLKVVGTKKQYQADPVKLLIARSLFTSRGVSYLDQVFGGDMKGFVKLLKTTTGIKPQQVDLESQKYFKELDQKRQLEDLLTRIGELKEFKSVYEPK